MAEMYGMFYDGRSLTRIGKELEIPSGCDTEGMYDGSGLRGA